MYSYVQRNVALNEIFIIYTNVLIYSHGYLKICSPYAYSKTSFYKRYANRIDYNIVVNQSEL